MLATPDRKDEGRLIAAMWTRMNNALSAVTDRMRARFNILDKSLSPKNTRSAVDVYSGRFRNCCDRMDHAVKMEFLGLRNRFNSCDSKLDPRRLADRLNGNMVAVDSLSSRMDSAVQNSMDRKGRMLDSLSAKMDGLNPSSVLERGYSFVRDSEGKVITSVKDLFPGTDVTIAMRDGSAVAKIKELRIDE